MTAAGDLRGKSGEDLQKQMTQLRKEMFNLRFQQATGQLANTSRMRVVRREVARISTILTERRRAAEPKKGV